MASKYSVSLVISAIRDSEGVLCEAAERLGCARSTVYEYVQRHPSVAQALADEREKLVDMAEKGLRKGVREGEAWAIQFTLKTQGRSRGYGDRGPSTAEPLMPMLSLESSEEWRHIKRTLLEVLQQHPAALADVAAALSGLAANGHGHVGNGHGIS